MKEKSRQMKTMEPQIKMLVNQAVEAELAWIDCGVKENQPKEEEPVVPENLISRLTGKSRIRKLIRTTIAAVAVVTILILAGNFQSVVKAGQWVQKQIQEFFQEYREQRQDVGAKVTEATETDSVQQMQETETEELLEEESAPIENMESAYLREYNAEAYITLWDELWIKNKGWANILHFDCDSANKIVLWMLEPVYTASTTTEEEGSGYLCAISTEQQWLWQEKYARFWIFSGDYNSDGEKDFVLLEAFTNEEREWKTTLIGEVFLKEKGEYQSSYAFSYDTNRRLSNSYPSAESGYESDFCAVDAGCGKISIAYLDNSDELEEENAFLVTSENKGKSWTTTDLSSFHMTEKTGGYATETTTLQLWLFNHIDGLTCVYTPLDSSVYIYQDRGNGITLADTQEGEAGAQVSDVFFPTAEQGFVAFCYPDTEAAPDFWVWENKPKFGKTNAWTRQGLGIVGNEDNSAYGYGRIVDMWQWDKALYVDAIMWKKDEEGLWGQELVPLKFHFS